MLELIQSGAVREAVLLTALRQDIHGDVANGDVARTIVKQVSVYRSLAIIFQLLKAENQAFADCYC